MTGFRIPNASEAAWLTLVTDVDMTIRLFTNEVEAGLTPTQIDALAAGSFTEASFSGYAAISITAAWTITQSTPSVATTADRTFTRTITGAAQNVWGYYLTRNSDGALVGHEQFLAPVSVVNAADFVTVRPRITLDDTEGTSVQTGVITLWGALTAPDGYLLCNGAAVSRTTYADLFAVLGTAYGVGDGATTFNLPDLRQRFPLGKATAGTGATLGSTGGTVDHVHALDTATSHAKIYVTSTGNELRSTRKTVASYTTTHEDTSGALSIGGGAAGNTAATSLGGDTDADNPPYQVVNYIVKT